MPNTFRLLFNGQPAPEVLYTQMTTLEVEENADMPGAFELHLPLSRNSDGDLTFINDDSFQPFANIAVVVTAEGERPECIFDGYVLSHKLHVEKGITASSVRIWGQDASWLMNLEDKVKEWVDVTDAAVANSVFGDYGFAIASKNTDDDSPVHTEDVYSLMQKSTDIQFLRMLARRSGKLARVACEDKPGLRTGYFSRPSLDGTPAATLNLNDKENWNVDALNIEWDVVRPTEVTARVAVFSSDDEDGVAGDASSSGLETLDQRNLADFAGRAMKAQLTASASDAGDLLLRSQAMLTDAGWFVRCEGEADVARLKKVLRVDSVVQIAGAGSVHSGKYYVWSVRHSIGQDFHKMKFVLVRNAVGPPPSSGAGGLLGGL